MLESFAISRGKDRGNALNRTFKCLNSLNGHSAAAVEPSPNTLYSSYRAMKAKLTKGMHTAATFDRLVIAMLAHNYWLNTTHRIAYCKQTNLSNICSAGMDWYGFHINTTRRKRKQREWSTILFKASRRPQNVSFS